MSKALDIADWGQYQPKRKNCIINGGMDIWQRGFSFTGVVTNDYTADRLAIANFSTAVMDVTRSVDVPTAAQAGTTFNYSYRLDVTTADATIGIGEATYIRYGVEGYDYKPLYKQDQTFSFWIKTNKVGVYGVSFRSTAGDVSYISEITVNAANTWEKKTVTITAKPSSGTWTFINGVGVTIGICLLGGSNVQTTPDAWQIGGFLTTSNQVNLLDSISNYIQLTGLQLEKGGEATDFEYRHYAEELALCQRYYESSTALIILSAIKQNLASNWQSNSVFFSVTKRAAPTVLITSVNRMSGVPGTSAPTVTAITPFVAVAIQTWNIIDANTVTSSNILHYTLAGWTADAEL